MHSTFIVIVLLIRYILCANIGHIICGILFYSRAVTFAAAAPFDKDNII